jgi:hypothetical protein
VTNVENGGIFAAEKTFTNADVPLAFFLLATLVLLFLPARSPENRSGAPVLAGYFFVYVMTPLDLGYHLATSLNRFFLQLWPSVIFLFFMTAGAPETAASAGDRPGPRSAQPKTRPAKGNKPKRIQEPK